MIIITLVLSLIVFIWLEQVVVRYYRLIKKTKEVTINALYLGVLPYTIVVLVQTVIYGLHMTLTLLNLDKYAETFPLVIILTNGFLIPVLITNLILSIKVGYTIKSKALLLLPTTILIGTLNVILIKILAMVGLVLYFIKLIRGDLEPKKWHNKRLVRR